MTQRFLYLRDWSNPNKHPVGCIVMEVDRDGKKVSYALSACSPSDRFNPKVARDKAAGRLRSAPTVLETEIPDSSHLITRLVMENIAKSHTKQGTRSHIAYQAAVGWLAQSEKFLLKAS